MSDIQKRFLSQTRNIIFSLKEVRFAAILLLFFSPSASKSQLIANYVSNGSFEDFYTCAGPTYPINTIKSWSSIDSTSFAAIFFSKCNSYIPSNPNTFQFPLTGNSLIVSTFYCPNLCERGYPQNRLKANLLPGKKYCVKFYINITNNSPRAMDGFGAYFGGSSLDTITKCTIPLTYLNPQIKNPLGNVISDTLNWVPITGTFVATGEEKYLVLGNFLADNAVTTASLNSPFYPQHWTDVCIDDVSCVEVELAAYAGPDQFILGGDSVYLGRASDFAIDPFCLWYQLPNTTVAIDTASGLWVRPSQTTTYIVKQELECGSLKWDTVIVYVNPLGFQILNSELDFNISPQPADEYFDIKIRKELHSKYSEAIVYNIKGERILVIQLNLVNAQRIVVSSLPNGLYSLQLSGTNQKPLYKRILIEH